ncbi:MAG: cellulase family glycosylhydrolase [Muribaculaceae bacterium]|nr:cellulase family glycosylhydrolase [Muribaculaceae bacterium]
MKLMKFFVFLAAASMVMTGCGNDDKNSGIEFEGKGFNVSKTAITVGSEGGEQTLSVGSPVQPSVTTGNSWIKVASVEKTGSQGNIYTVTLTIDENTSTESREGAVDVKSGSEVKNVTVTQAGAEPEPVVPVTPDPASEVTGKTAKELAADMWAGINIGNTMECPGQEGAWSMVVNQTYVAGLAELGFKAVRIPCAWDTHATDGVIDPAWLARVDEVVGWVIDNGMYAMINTHWDGGWIENDTKNGYSEAINKKFASYWKQIAEQLNHYDQRLLFSALNEPNVDDANQNKSIDAIMKYEQTMVDVVRATGGNNMDRVLVMSVPNTNIDLGTAGYFKMPTDVVENRMMAEAHFYDTYQFNMMEEDANWGKTHWYWGQANFVAGSDRNSPHTEADVKAQMQKMKRAFVDKGYPVVLGEYCVCADRSNYKDIDVAKHQASQRDWNEVVTREAKNAGCVPFFWETGNDIYRHDGSVKRTYQLEGVKKGAESGTYPF